MRSSDWSSVVCSSDLVAGLQAAVLGEYLFGLVRFLPVALHDLRAFHAQFARLALCDFALVVVTQRDQRRWHRHADRAVPFRFVERCEADDRRAFGEAVAFGQTDRSEEHTSETQSLMRISYAVFCL